MERSSPRPTLIYDADCRFCGLCIAWCREHTGDAVEYISSIRARERFPEIPPEDLEKSVQYLLPDGGRRQFADAVFQALAASWMPARAVVWAQGHVPGVRQTLNLFYRIVARHRALFSFLTRILWGPDVRPPRGGA
jgi:predicted DCC family thiol-disulfide oxidoreductase YuxK